MDAQELLEKYDKAAVVVKQFYLAHMLESLNDDNLPENFKDFVREQGMSNEDVAIMINASPRTLFDVFDKYDINIVIHAYIEEPPTEFGYSIPQEGDKSATMDVYQTRKEAEIASVVRAFELLNEKL
jgi:hypothetical protein